MLLFKSLVLMKNIARQPLDSHFTLLNATGQMLDHRPEIHGVCIGPKWQCRNPPKSKHVECISLQKIMQTHEFRNCSL